MNSADLPFRSAPLPNLGLDGVDEPWVDAAAFRQRLYAWLEQQALGDAVAGDPHHTAAWFALLVDTAMPPDTRFGCWPLAGGLVLPLKNAAETPFRVESLVNFYTPLFDAVGNGAADNAQAEQFARSLAARTGCAELRLWPMDPQASSFGALERGLRRAGWLVDRFLCFGNWYHRVEVGGYARYFEERPSQLRNTVTRSAKKLARMDGYAIEIHTVPGPELDAAIFDFVQVYNRSWKRPEPFERFIPGLCHLASSRGWLRLGVMRVGGRAIASQLWLVFAGKGHIVKLAYDQEFDKASAGSVLTAALMERVIDVDHVDEVDYLIGDDAYKAGWMTQRRERWGLVAFNRRRLQGLAQGARHFGGRMLRKLRRPAVQQPQRAASVRGSLAYAAIEQYLMLTLQLVSYFVIARLLSPQQIGAFSVVSAVVGIGLSLRDFGTAAYIVQEPELTDERVRTAFGLTLAVAVALGAGIFIAAPWIASFYLERSLTSALRVLSLNFVLLPFGSTAMALLRRELNFRAVMIVNLCAAALQFGITMTLACRGLGAMSLVWAAVANCAATAALSLLFEPRHARLMPGFSQWRHVMNYGARNAGVNVVTQAAMNLNDLIVGRMLGLAPVALISRAQGVMNLMHQGLLGAVRTVMFPALAKAQREGGDVAAAHRQALNIITVIAWPFYGFVALFPTPLLRLMFGPQWDAAAALVPIFSVAGVFASMWTLSTSLLLASGNVNLFVRAEVTVQFSRLLLLGACALVAPTVVAFACTFMLCYVGFMPLYRHYCRRALGNGRLEDPVGLRRSAAVTLASLALPALLRLLSHAGVLPPIAPWAVIPIGMLCLLGWFLAVRVLAHPIASDPAFRRLTNLLRLGRSRPPSATAGSPP